METACRRFMKRRNNAVFLACSPRKRGWLRLYQHGRASTTVFPAQAGVAPEVYSGHVLPFCVPRASGGDSGSNPRAQPLESCSPRKRG